MPKITMKALKQEMIKIGKMLWEKDLVVACSGNVSLRADRKNILLTTHNCCLGMLREEDIVQIGLDGKVKGDKIVTMEKPIHMMIHRTFPHSAVIHAHPPFSIGYFSVQDSLDCLTFESHLLLGDVPCIKQEKETITDLESIISALKKSNIIALKRHGVIAIGNSLREAFFRIQLLEEAVKINLAAEIFSKR